MEAAVRRKGEAGQALILTAIGLAALMGFAGLGVDMGVMRYEKRLQQTAADAAAIAGANDLSYGGVTVGAQNASAANGFTDNGGGAVSACTASGAAVGTVCVQVNNPPASGPHNGNAQYVEVLVAAVHPTFFMRILGISSTAITARAVATNLSGGSNEGCLYTLGAPSSSIEGVNINGSAILNAPNCGIVDNGNFNTKGNKLIVNADTFGTSGDWSKSGPGGTVTCTAPGPCPTINMPAATDPLSYLTPPSCSPSAPGCTGGNVVTINGAGNANCGTGCSYSNGTYTISPGQYSSITIKGVASDQVVFNQGTYVIDGAGGLTISGNATISGNGVTFYFTGNATINMTGTPTMNLTAPSSGQYAGILMYQDPSDTNTTGPSVGGNTGTNYGGVLYFPKDQLTFYGNNTSVNVGIVVSDSYALSGNPTVNLLGNAGLPPGVNLILDATLVE
jgi:Putative Flp pilus-assembly TadE/G-like